jgi:exopolysaccharide biosynthesis protein
MVELADMMTALGAENAINLDGGGSSTMYSRTGTGAFGVVNEPSDGTERLVPNAFGVVYHGELPPVIPILPPTVPPTTPPTTAP